MATTRMGLGGPIAALPSEEGGGSLPAPTGGGSLMLMGVRSFLIFVLLTFS